MAAGHGHVDFADAVGALHDIGFDGWLALECNLRGDPMDALAQGSAVLRPLLERAPS